jgi:tetratricopeptide (TPR) repeat protein
MKRIITLTLVAVFALTSCSKMDRAKRAYKKGDYQTTIDLLSKYIKTNASNTEAQQYLLFAQGGILADSAASLIKANRFEEALTLADRALRINNKNEDARILIDAALKGIVTRIERDLVPNKTWSGVLNMTSEVLKYRPDDPRMSLLYAQSVYELENQKLSWKSILAIQKASYIVKDNDFITGLLNKQTELEKPFATAFLALQQTFLQKNYKAWRPFASSQYIKECENDVARLKERGDSNIKSVEDYFLAIAGDADKYGNPEGPGIVCIEVLSPTRAFVHYAYKRLPKNLKMEVFRNGNSFKFDREQDSEIKVFDQPS